jgi:hypothetical protein
MENTIFFGNGINYNDSNFISWKDILNGMKVQKFSDKTLSNTMIYERILLDKKLLYGDSIKKQIIEKLNTIKTNEIYNLMHKSNIRNFITTNYDYGFIHNLSTNPNVKIENLGNEITYSIRRVKQIIDNQQNNKKFLWQIHGELKYPRTIMLGLNHYCGSIGKIGNYLKEKYDSGKNSNKEIAIKEKIVTNSFSNISWIDLFFNTHIHIIGYSLDYSETDIWWILNRRARLKNESELKNKIVNKIHFYCANIDKEKQGLLESFDIIVHIITQEEHLKIEDYKKIISQIDIKTIT